jgi:hypothetical protein
MKTDFEFFDPFFSSSLGYKENGIRIIFPHVDEKNIREVARQTRLNAEKYFSSHSMKEIQTITDAVDSAFVDLARSENEEVVDLIQKSSGFSAYDIKRWGLGLFKSVVSYDPDMRGYFMNRALREKGIIHTRYGYLKRIGHVNPFSKWKEPALISHFISGNVVGYTAILSKLGFPLKLKGAAQFLKLPSSASVFPLIYLKKLEEIDADLRKTIACGYWKGGDDLVERKVIEESDAINILSSDHSIKDLTARVGKYHKGITTLLHGHKIGVAYVSKEFILDEGMREQTLNGLVTDISAFDGGACYTVKNIYVQGDPVRFAEDLFIKLELFGKDVSPVSNQSKPLGTTLSQVYMGSGNIISSDEHNALVRIGKNPEFWKPDELFRYVQVMRVKDENEVIGLIRNQSHYLQTVILAVPDEKIIPLMLMFGQAGASNIHYPGSAPLINIYEEPHDGEFDAVRVRYNYAAHFVATNFKTNRDWIN